MTREPPQEHARAPPQEHARGALPEHRHEHPPHELPQEHPREFPRVLASEVVSNFGSMLSRLAIPWLATLTLGASAAEMGLLLVADVLAGALGALALGTLVDRHSKRAVMLLADLLRAALLAGLAAFALLGWLSFWMLVLAAACGGVLSMAFELARSAWVARSVPVAELPKRNAQLSIGGSLSETAAFALGGWLYQGFGAVVALALDAASYLVSALCLRGVRDAPPDEPTAEPPAVCFGATPGWRSRLRAFLADAGVGLRAVAAQPTLRALAAVEVLVALGMSIAGTSYMIFVSRDIAFDTGVLGMVFAAGGLGSVAGAALAPKLGRRFGAGRTMTFGLSLLALGALCIPLVGAVGVLGIVLLATHQIVGDGGQTLHNIHDRTLRQTLAEPALLARVDAGIRTLGQGATLFGALAGGALATAFGARWALWLSTAVYAAAAAVAFATLARRATRLAR